MKKLFTLMIMLVALCLNAQADSWTVAGSSTDVFGTSWDPSNTANDMTDKGNGTFEWSKEVTLPKGSVNFKVCKDHAWDEAYPAQDYVLPISESGIYDIVITFNSSTQAVNATATKKADAVVLPTVTMHGQFTGDWADTAAFTVAQGDESCSLTLTLGVGTYEFGMKFDGTWTANGATLTRANNTTNLSSGSGNMKITADVAGDYTFTYTYDTQQLSVTYPEYVEVTHTYTVAASFAGSNWAPDNTAFDMTADGQVYTLTLNNIELHKGTWYGYKVCVDHDWPGAYGKNGADNGDNAELPTAAANGFYTVVITLDLSAENPIPSAVITKTADIDASEVFIAAGCLYEGETENDAAGFVGAKWDKDNTANQLSEVKEGVWTKTYTSVPAGTYGFKVVAGYDWDTAYPDNNIIFTLTEATDVAVYFYEADNRVELLKGNVVEVVVPEAVDGTQYLTYGNLDHAVSFAGIEGIEVSTVTYDAAVGCTRKHDVASKKVPAKTAVVLFKETGFTGTLKLPVLLEEAANLGDNDLKVSNGSVQGAEDIFCLSNGENGLGFYPVDASIQVPANKAYLKLNLGKQAAPSYVWFDGETTGIDALENGEATAEKAGAIYTLDGRRVNGNLSHGLYIQNGKKFVVK